MATHSEDHGNQMSLDHQTRQSQRRTRFKSRVKMMSNLNLKLPD